MEENKPPTNLKQGKLPFLKRVPHTNTSPKTSPQIKGRKRRSSGTNGIESPNKSIKLAKPLTQLAVDNADCAKAAKTGKILTVGSKHSEENDHEVSSSSEAESGCGKNGTFLERFVRKLPQDRHQEISSTNEMLELSQENEVPLERIDLTEEENEACKEENVQDESREKDDIVKETIKSKHVQDEETALTGSETKCKMSEVADKDTVKDKNVGAQINNEEKSEMDQTTNELQSSEMDDTGHQSSISLLDETENFGCEINNITKDLNKSSQSSCNADSGSPKTSKTDDSKVTPSKKRSSKTPQNGSEKKVIKSSEKNSAKKAALKAEKLKQREAKEQERLERKRKQEEEKAEKLRMKQERKEAKDKEKQEKKDKLERERLEKEKAKEEERKKREEEKMKKEDERKKKQAELEAKQEEKRKKEEEKRLKEEEKLREEEEKKKKEERTKQHFQNFFIKAKDTPPKPSTPKPTGGMFIPFEVKKDMHLAPAVRRDALSGDKRRALDQILCEPHDHHKTYLGQLKDGEIKPHRTGRVLRKNPQPPEDVEIVHDSEALKKVFHKVKLLQFHTDYRPPYYGTWQKHPNLTARNPWKKDECMFDYEVDSDDEWEEEEPGESLSCSDGEEEKGDDAEEDEDDGWMVPHGYLSEDEGCNEDDEITPEKLKLQQQAKAKAWEEEQKRKFQAAPQITVGCFFEYTPSSIMSGDVRLLYEFRAVILASSTPISTVLFGNPESEVVEDSVMDTSSIPATPKGCQKMAVPDEAVPDLIHLVHGNPFGIKRLIKEFRVFWQRKLNAGRTDQLNSSVQEDKLNESLSETIGDVSGLNESLNEPSAVSEADKLPGKNELGKEEDGKDCNISKRQLEMKITSLAVREKRTGFNKTCWFVHENILKEYDLADLKLPNTWEFLTFDPTKSPGMSVVKKDQDEEEKVEEVEIPVKPVPRDQRSIIEFALSKAEIEKKTESPSSEAPEENSVKAAKDETPREGKKPNNQRSIMDFARKSDKKQESPQPQNSGINECSSDVEIGDVSAQSVEQKNVMEAADSGEAGNLTAPPPETVAKSSPLVCVKDIGKERMITFKETAIDSLTHQPMEVDQLAEDSPMVNDLQDLTEDSVSQDCIVID